MTADRDQVVRAYRGKQDAGDGAGVTPGSEPIERETIVGVYAGLSPDDYPILSTIMGSAEAQQFDSERQFENLLDAYVRGLEARIGERG